MGETKVPMLVRISKSLIWVETMWATYVIAGKGHGSFVRTMLLTIGQTILYSPVR